MFSQRNDNLTTNERGEERITMRAIDGRWISPGHLSHGVCDTSTMAYTTVSAPKNRMGARSLGKRSSGASGSQPSHRSPIVNWA